MMAPLMVEMMVLKRVCCLGEQRDGMMAQKMAPSRVELKG